MLHPPKRVHTLRFCTPGSSRADARLLVTMRKAGPAVAHARRAHDPTSTQPRSLWSVLLVFVRLLVFFGSTSTRSVAALPPLHRAFMSPILFLHGRALAAAARHPRPTRAGRRTPTLPPPRTLFQALTTRAMASAGRTSTAEMNNIPPLCRASQGNGSGPCSWREISSPSPSSSPRSWS